jgi:hypothetical protein
MQKLYLAPDGRPWFVTDEVRQQDYRGPAPARQASPAAAPRTTTAPRGPLVRRPGG